MHGTEDDAIFDKDGDGDESDTDDIHHDVPTKESDFKQLLEHSDDDLVIVKNVIPDFSIQNRSIKCFF